MIEITDLKKEYTLNGRKKYALDAISVKIPEGCFVSVIGPSGAGKSTLLRSINGMISVDGGKVEINGKNISSLKGKEKREVQKNICMIFQDFCLVKSSTVIKNVLNACLAVYEFVFRSIRYFRYGKKSQGCGNTRKSRYG